MRALLIISLLVGAAMAAHLREDWSDDDQFVAENMEDPEAIKGKLYRWGW
ncbi:hypothetical protein BIW11_04251 [Tropilaelaps mercedesae]|uniref:Uncharacterized protein n=1 Tax=Tropilaelaps mercedesae TaxID=418985 RepID=A0A1V9X9D0_9ACAR|nr:hypothetical protein BIW11_04251 [Tropilaelaps mercedesae]